MCSIGGVPPPAPFLRPDPELWNYEQQHDDTNRSKTRVMMLLQKFLDHSRSDVVCGVKRCVTAKIAQSDNGKVSRWCQPQVGIPLCVRAGVRKGIAAGPGTVSHDPTMGIARIVGIRRVQLQCGGPSQNRRVGFMRREVKSCVICQINYGAMDRASGANCRR